VNVVSPMPGKRDSDWGDAWMPLLDPLSCGIVAAFLY